MNKQFTRRDIKIALKHEIVVKLTQNQRSTNSKISDTISHIGDRSNIASENVNCFRAS